MYWFCYVSFSFSVFFSQSTEVNKEHFCMCGGLTLAGGQMPTQLLSHSHLQQVGGENTMKKLLGQDKDREMAYQLPSQAKQARLVEN